MPGWSDETLNDIVDGEIQRLPRDARARLSRFAEIVESYGLAALPSKTTKHIEDKLWELRLTGRDNIARVIYVTAAGRRIVLLSAFVKKTQKTPIRELALARPRARSVT